MNTIEIEGKTIDEAIAKACAEFDVPRQKLQIQILSEGSSGFLGIGSRKACIRAGLLNFSLDVDAPEEKPRDVRRSIPPSAGTPIPKRKEAPSTPHPEKQEQREAPNVLSIARPNVPEGEVALEAKEILEGILARMGLKYPVNLEETEEYIVLNILGDGGGLLIGKRGQNLDALQYIVNKAAYRTGNGKKAIVVDTETYRKRREDSVVSLAERLGDKVKKTKKPLTVSHMNAHDRRIIHMTLQNDAELTTKSRGEGEYRKIIIMPVRKQPRDQANANGPQ
jgi:spoIIIJ-associated protein